MNVFIKENYNANNDYFPTIAWNIRFNIRQLRGVNMKEFNIRISMYNDESEQAFRLFLFKNTSLLDSCIIAKALKQYYKSDYVDIEIIN